MFLLTVQCFAFANELVSKDYREGIKYNIWDKNILIVLIAN